MSRPLLAVLLVLSGCAVAPSAASSSQLDDPAVYADAIVAASNRARADRDLRPLAPSTCAAEQALARAKALVGVDLEHADLKPVISACSPPSGLAAENLSRAAAAPEAVVAAWLDSPGHANNLLSPQLTQLGVACVPTEVEGKPQMLCAQAFLG